MWICLRSYRSSSTFMVFDLVLGELFPFVKKLLGLVGDMYCFGVESNGRASTIILPQLLYMHVQICNVIQLGLLFPFANCIISLPWQEGGDHNRQSASVVSPLPACRGGLLVCSLSVCPSVCPSVTLRFSRLFCAVVWDIDLKFSLWICYDIIQIEFEFRHAWPTFTGVIALRKNLLFRTFFETLTWN